jgi:hypothetical protein
MKGIPSQQSIGHQSYQKQYEQVDNLNIENQMSRRNYGSDPKTYKTYGETETLNNFAGKTKEIFPTITRAESSYEDNNLIAGRQQAQSTQLGQPRIDCTRNRLTDEITVATNHGEREYGDAYSLEPRKSTGETREQEYWYPSGDPATLAAYARHEQYAQGRKPERSPNDPKGPRRDLSEQERIEAICAGHAQITQQRWVPAFAPIRSSSWNHPGRAESPPLAGEGLNGNTLDVVYEQPSSIEEPMDNPHGRYWEDSRTDNLSKMKIAYERFEDRTEQNSEGVDDTPIAITNWTSESLDMNEQKSVHDTSLDSQPLITHFQTEVMIEPNPDREGSNVNKYLLTPRDDVEDRNHQGVNPKATLRYGESPEGPIQANQYWPLNTLNANTGELQYWSDGMYLRVDDPEEHNEPTQFRIWNDETDGQQQADLSRGPTPPPTFDSITYKLEQQKLYAAMLAEQMEAHETWTTARRAMSEMERSGLIFPEQKWAWELVRELELCNDKPRQIRPGSRLFKQLSPLREQIKTVRFFANRNGNS